MGIEQQIEQNRLFNSLFCNLLTELVVVCDAQGIIIFANQAVQQWNPTPLIGHSFYDLLIFDDTDKGERFFNAVTQATPDHPTDPWELLIGTEATYTIATLRGYFTQQHAIIIGQVQSEEISTLHQEMNALLSELSESQREIRRQNLVLHQALSEQRQLVRTILHLSSPAVPIWNVSMILSLIGKRTTDDMIPRLIQEIIQREQYEPLQYLILDFSTVSPDSVLETIPIIIQVLQSLEIEPVLADAGSGIIAALRAREIDLPIPRYQDLHQAITYVGAKIVARNLKPDTD